MNDKRVFTLHKFALSAIFIIGNAVTELPQKGADEFSFLAFILSSFLIFVVYILSDLIFGFLLNNSSVFGGILKIIMLLVVAIFASFMASSVFSKTLKFISAVILPNTKLIYIVLLLFAVTLYFIFKRQENILKFSLISFVFIGIIILFFFLAASDRFDFKNIVILRLPTFSEITAQTKPFLWSYILPAVILPVYFKFVFKGCKRGAALGGILAGTALAGLSVLMPLFLFGPEFAGRLDYPFSSAISTVTVGRLFTRLDGFSYFVFFGCAIIKITVCAFVVYNSLKIINQTMKKGTE